jgi:hypothetical protein
MWSTSGIALRSSWTGPGVKVALLQFKKMVFRYRQKIFTTNNHYEWSKSPVAPEIPCLEEFSASFSGTSYFISVNKQP